MILFKVQVRLYKYNEIFVLIFGIFFCNDLVLPAAISHCIIFWGEKHYSWPNLLLVIGEKGKEKAGKVMEF